MKPAHLGRLGAGDIHLLAGGWTYGRSRFLRLRIDGDGHYALRTLKCLSIRKCRQCHRLLHKLGPDGIRRRRARKPQFPVVIKTNPDCSQQIGRISRKPAVPRCPRFSGRRGVESPRSDAGCDKHHICRGESEFHEIFFPEN
jgi:hypothetical protein